MKHVILGWGSLLWDKTGDILPLRSGWSPEGPSLPLEFSRVSRTRNGALTLVVDPENGQMCRSRFAESKRIHIDDAISDLRCREGTVTRCIGFVDLVSGEQRSNTCPSLADQLRSWGDERGFASVIWTDLPSNFNEGGRGEFSIMAAADYLRSLGPEGARRAREYIGCAPSSADTPLRRYLINAEWWRTFGDT